MNADAAEQSAAVEHLRAEVEKALKTSGRSARQVSLEAVGHDGLIRDLRAGRSLSYDRVALLARSLNLELYFGPPRARPPEPPTIELDGDDFAAIPKLAVEASAGTGAINHDAPEVVGKLAFRRDWLRKIGVRPDRAMLITVTGDSMRPNLKPGDLVLVDLDRRNWDNNRVYAFNDPDEGLRIKRALRDKRGLVLVSDNPAWPPQTFLGREADRLIPLGQVVWSGHRWG